MDDAFDESVVTEGEKALPFRIPRVPTAKRRRSLVGEQDKVLGVVKHRLSSMMLWSGRACLIICKGIDFRTANPDLYSYPLNVKSLIVLYGVFTKKFV